MKYSTVGLLTITSEATVGMSHVTEALEEADQFLGRVR